MVGRREAVVTLICLGGKQRILALVLIFSLTCQDARGWCGHHHTWPHFLLQLQKKPNTHLYSGVTGVPPAGFDPHTFTMNNQCTDHYGTQMSIHYKDFILLLVLFLVKSLMLFYETIPGIFQCKETEKEKEHQKGYLMFLQKVTPLPNNNILPPLHLALTPSALLSKVQLNFHLEYFMYIY